MTDIFVIIFLILLNGLFSMTEMALVSARRSKLNTLAANGKKGARTALELTANPDRFLSTIQIGITLIGILTGLFSGSAFSRQLGEVFAQWGLPGNLAYNVAQMLIIIVVTYLSIVVGELVPKRIGLSMSDRIAVAMAPLMKCLSVLALPFVWLLSVSTEFCARILGIRHKTAKITEDEIKSLIQEGTEAGEVKEVEQDIMERVLVLGDQTVNRIMTNRADIVSLHCGMSEAEIKRIVLANLHRAYPFYCEDAKCIKGILSLKDILETLDSGAVDWERKVSQPAFFPESMTAYDALEVLRNDEVPCGLVCDEFGEVQGIVTLRDVLEGLIGMINNPLDTPGIMTADGLDTTLIVDGQYKWYDFLAHIDRVDLYTPSTYSTVAGWLLHTLRHIPSEGETTLWHGIEFRILDMDGARIDKVMVTLPASVSGNKTI